MKISRKRRNRSLRCFGWRTPFSPINFWRLGQALHPVSGAEMRFRDLSEVLSTVLLDENARRLFDLPGSSFGKKNIPLLAHAVQAADKLIARQDRSRGDCQILFGFVALHQFE